MLAAIQITNFRCKHGILQLRAFTIRGAGMANWETLLLHHDYHIANSYTHDKYLDSTSMLFEPVLEELASIYLYFNVYEYELCIKIL